MATENNRGKKYVASATGLNRDELHDMTAAVTKVKSMAKAKFDETLDLAVRLGLDAAPFRCRLAPAKPCA
jgi:large subunit ribosomal protein L1